MVLISYQSGWKDPPSGEILSSSQSVHHWKYKLSLWRNENNTLQYCIFSCMFMVMCCFGCNVCIKRWHVIWSLSLTLQAFHLLNYLNCLVEYNQHLECVYSILADWIIQQYKPKFEDTMLTELLCLGLNIMICFDL